MTIPLLLAALASAGVGAWLSRRSQVAGRVLMALGGLGLVGFIVLQVRQYVFSPEPKPPSRYHMAVSSCLANCLLADFAGHNGSVVLLFPQRRYMDEDTERSYEEGLGPALRHGRAVLKLKAVHLEGADRHAGQDLPAFKQALAQAQDAMAIFSYAGVPADFDTLTSTEQPKIPPFYVFDAEGTTNWLAALKAGRIRAVVLPRPGVNPRGREAVAGTPGTIVEQFYLLATPANADQVAASLKARN
jgi:hypothetical protein